MNPCRVRHSLLMSISRKQNLLQISISIDRIEHSVIIVISAWFYLKFDMKLVLVVILVVATAAITYAAESKVGAGRDLAGLLLKIIDTATSYRAVVVENWSGRTIRFWCASKNDRIRRNGYSYIDIPDQKALGWTFQPNVFPGFSGRTLFWCTFCYKNKRRGWNVYDQTWEKQNSVPENGLLRWRIIYDSVRWEYTPLKKGWDFKSWKPQGNC